MFKLNDNPISIYQDLVIGDGDNAITHPAANLASADYRASLGIVEVPDQPRPDDRMYLVTPNGDGTYTATPKDIDELKSIKSSEIANNRYALEVAGVELPNGAKIKTDRESQSLIASALMRVQRNVELMIDWKGENGWVRIGKAEVEMIADAVGDHVQACFTAERQKHEALMAIDDAEAIIAFDTSISVQLTTS